MNGQKFPSHRSLGAAQRCDIKMSKMRFCNQNLNFYLIFFSDFSSPQSRYVPPMDSDYYEGTGYGKVVIDKPSSNLIVTITVFTRSENGLLFYIGSEVNVCSYGYFINLTFECHLAELYVQFTIILFIYFLFIERLLYCDDGEGCNFST